jgi:hypothetical protein
MGNNPGIWNLQIGKEDKLSEFIQQPSFSGVKITEI